MYCRLADCPGSRAPRVKARPPQDGHRAPLPLLAAAAAFALEAAGCGAAWPACASDVDCGAATVCDRGQCRSEANAPRVDLRPQRLALTPQSDTTVVSLDQARGEAFANLDQLAAGQGETGAIYRTYLSFDLEEIAEAEVVRAQLRLASSPERSQGDEVLALLAYPAASSWSDQSLTWTTQPGGTGPPIASAAIRPAYNGETVIDVTDLVAGWVTSAIPNRGLLIRARNERPGLRAVWYSSESALVDRRPVLEVEVL